MSLLRIRVVEAVGGFRLRLTLTDGSVVERDVEQILRGPVFEPLRSDAKRFREVRVEGGTVVWSNGADLCPDVLIRGGPPPETDRRPAASAIVAIPAPGPSFRLSTTS